MNAANSLGILCKQLKIGEKLLVLFHTFSLMTTDLVESSFHISMAARIHLCRLR